MHLTTREALLLLFFCPSTWGYDVLVSVTGNLIGNTCVVALDSLVQDVALGTIGIKQFSEVGSVSNIKTPFIIKLEDCGPTFSGVKIRFSGIPDKLSPELLKLSDTSANGVAIEILDHENVRIPLDKQTVAYGKPGNDSLEIKFYARLISTNSSVRAGNVNALATWTMEYQ